MTNAITAVRRIDIGALHKTRDRLAAIKDPRERATAAWILSAQAAAAHRQLIDARPQIAASLRDHFGHTLGDLRGKLDLNSRDGEAFTEELETIADAPKYRDAEDLWERATEGTRELTQLRLAALKLGDVAADEGKPWTPRPDLDLSAYPQPPEGDAEVIQAWLQKATERARALREDRNRLGATLVQRHAWPLTTVAKLADTKAEQIAAAEPFPARRGDEVTLAGQLVDAADYLRVLREQERTARGNLAAAQSRAPGRPAPEMVDVDLAALTSEAARLDQLEPAELAKEGNLLAGRLRALRDQVLSQRDAAAATLHRDHGWTLSGLTSVMRPGSRNLDEVKRAVADYSNLTVPDAEAELHRTAPLTIALWDLFLAVKAKLREAGDPGRGASISTQADLEAIGRELDEIVAGLPPLPARVTAKGAAEAAQARLDAIGALLDGAELSRERLTELRERRNRLIAGLIFHHGYKRAQALRLAGGLPGQTVLPDPQDAAPAEDSTPEEVMTSAAEVRRIDHLRKGLVAEQNTTKTTMKAIRAKSKKG